ncbi:MAG: xanthine dehydrogenase family protein molybdopterin-binding subunit, partial [Betaproteobacteria bacterium]|nr:xanthine dehydrogenase family protein molybdopterin-binding subunit [Betaproteobacteria bacterium]
IAGSAAVGSGLALGIPLLVSTELAAAEAAPEIGAWVVIRPDDTVVVRVVRSEMGQGTLTGLAQLVAEELECDWSKIITEYPTPGESLRRKRVWGSFSTGGSRGIRESHEYVRKGGAAARMMLVQAAANTWGVSADQCTAANSVITHGATGRKVSFGSVAEAASKLPVPTEIVLKDPKVWKVIGKRIRRLDTRDKVNGSRIYGIDLKFPDMLNATIRECPVFGGKLKSFDGAKALKMKGVRHVVAVGETAVAVVADTFWQAKTGIEAVAIEWDEGPNAKVSSESIAQNLQEGLSAQQAFVGNENGNMAAAMTAATSKLESQFFYPYQNHATMEPMNATARWTPERCDVWVPTQDGESSLAATIAAAGIPADKCDVHKINLGGGFGRRGAFQDYTRQAVLIAKQIPGTHIKLIWTREEDMTQGRYHPIMACKITGTFDASKKLTGIHMRLSGQSILAVVRPAIVEQQKGRDPAVFQGVADSGEHAFGYTIPNLMVDHAMRNQPIPPGFWRGVNVNQNAIFFECFMDELAETAGADAVEFRRQFLGNHPRNLAALNAAAEAIGWTKPAPAGVFRGIAQMKAYGSFVAAACELSVRDGNKVKIHRMVAATDPGYAVNPAQIERQVSGSFVYGLSALFEQECTVKAGRIEQKNFDTYNSIRLAQMPKVETIILQGGGPEWGGIGEPTICVAAPAVLNALYRATGKRYRTVPLKKHGITLV